MNSLYEVNKDSFVHYTLPAKLTTSEVVEFINSKNPIENRFGILRARFYPDELFIPEIEKNIASYPDDLKKSALLTLSVLTGRRLGIDDYEILTHSSRQPTAKLASFDCHDLKKRNPEALTERDRPILNTCLRLFVRDSDMEWIDWLEGQGWLASPVYKSNLKWIKAAFK